MNSPEETRLLDHEADGIKELDNQLPRWWVWLFYITIAFALAYVVYYHVLKLGKLQAAEYQMEMELGERIKSRALAAFEASMSQLAPSTDPSLLSLGQEKFVTLCAPCHRHDGGGLVGPNLCDDYHIHGSNYVDSVRTIVNGVPEKGMITWKTLMQPREIEAVASYIYTLRGTKPVNPKPPENQLIPEAPNQYE